MKTPCEKQHAANSPIRIGWGACDITPDQPVQLCGQFHIRISEGIQDPVTATALALSSGEGADETRVVMVSCDVAVISLGLLTAVRKRLSDAVPDLPVESVILNATHSHSSPEIRTLPDAESAVGGINSVGLDIDIPAQAPEAYVEFAAERITQAIRQAWNTRAPGSIGYGLGHAVVGRNRRSCYLGGTSRMYGNTAVDDFSHIEGYEDHSVNLLGTWNAEGTLTGLVVNVPCPSQVSENIFQVSADYWHDTRVEIRARLGQALFILPQCSAAGDQSPRVQWGRAAEERMLRLAGRSLRQEIAVRIADAVTAALPLMEKERMERPSLTHHAETKALSRRKLSQADVDETQAEIEPLQQRLEALEAALAADPALREVPRWYVDITKCYRRIQWCKGVARRYAAEKESPTLPMELNVIRLGDVAIATNPFEYYLDFGICIKARSPAVQTFLVQLAGGGTYVPTERAVAGKSYGAIPASTPVGPEGGREIVEWTVARIRKSWNSQDT